MTHTLSVIVPNYNHAHYLPTSLGAIVAQGRAADEIIVIDDGSDDDSLEVIGTFARQFDNIRVISCGDNQGLTANCLLALREARGEYIYWAAADDRVLPGLFESSMDQLRRHPGAALCFSDPASFGDNGVIKVVPLRLSEKPKFFAPAAIVAARRQHVFDIAHHTAPVKTAILREMGAFNPRLKWHCDWFTLWVMAFRHGACYIPRPLAAIRTSRDSYSSPAMRTAEEELSVYRSMLELLDSADYSDVAGAFRESCAFSICGFKMWRVMGERPRWASYRSPRLLSQIMRNQWWRVVGARTPKWMRGAYRRIAVKRTAVIAE